MEEYERIVAMANEVHRKTMECPTGYLVLPSDKFDKIVGLFLLLGVLVPEDLVDSPVV